MLSTNTTTNLFIHGSSINEIHGNYNGSINLNLHESGQTYIPTRRTREALPGIGEGCGVRFVKTSSSIQVSSWDATQYHIDHHLLDYEYSRTGLILAPWPCRCREICDRANDLRESSVERIHLFASFFRRGSPDRGTIINFIPTLAFQVRMSRTDLRQTRSSQTDINTTPEVDY